MAFSYTVGTQDGISTASNELWGHNSLDRGCRPYDPAEKGRFYYEAYTGNENQIYQE